MGLFDGEKLEKTFRMTTGISRTSDEFGVFLGELLRMRNLPLDVIDEVIIASGPCSNLYGNFVFYSCGFSIFNWT